MPPAKRALVSRGANLVIVGGVVSGTWSLTNGEVEIAWFAGGGRPGRRSARGMRSRGSRRSWIAGYLTLMLVSNLPKRSASVQTMTIGTGPVLSFRPTSHFHVTAPFEPAIFGSRPLADELPDSYRTSMPHSAPSVVSIVTDAFAFLATFAVLLVELHPEVEHHIRCLRCDELGRAAAPGTAEGRRVRG